MTGALPHGGHPREGGKKNKEKVDISTDDYCTMSTTRRSPAELCIASTDSGLDAGARDATR